VAKVILGDGQQFDINRHLEEEQEYINQRLVEEFEEEEENSEMSYLFRNFFGY